MNILSIKDILEVGESITLGELGLDSLMVVEVSQVVEQHRNLKLTVQEIRALTFAMIKDM